MLATAQREQRDREAGQVSLFGALVLGTELAVSYMEELYPVTVGSTDSTSLFDPANERTRS